LVTKITGAATAPTEPLELFATDTAAFPVAPPHDAPKSHRAIDELHVTAAAHVRPVPARVDEIR